LTAYADHPFASIFPMMAPDEYGALREDIRAHGLREPIWLFEGQILDGRNRYRACQDVGVTPRADTYIGDDPIAFVISLNLQRRHLTPGQKADVALRAEAVFAAAAKQRQRDAGKAYGRGKGKVRD
jgi:ParB-like chromosome segregation protein Spo0J